MKICACCDNPIPPQNDKYCSKTCAQIGAGPTTSQIDEVMHDYTTPQEQAQINQALKELSRQTQPPP